MLIYDDIYKWDGWGGKFKLASGKCRLRIFDLRENRQKSVALFKPFVVIVADIPSDAPQGPNQMTVKSCASHIATRVVKEFDIDPFRMVWVEHYPLDDESKKLRYVPKERFDEVEFYWRGKEALHPKWKNLVPAMETLVKELVQEQEDETA